MQNAHSGHSWSPCSWKLCKYPRCMYVSRHRRECNSACIHAAVAVSRGKTRAVELLIRATAPTLQQGAHFQMGMARVMLPEPVFPDMCFES